MAAVAEQEDVDFLGFDDEDEDEFIGSASDPSEEQDSAEEELEKLVFGDAAGFREGIAKAARRQRSRVEIEGQDEEGFEEGSGFTGLEAVDDAALFFLDSGITRSETALIPSPVDVGSDEEHSGEGEPASRRPPAWEDSDDERLRVSIASVPRLRKLRKYEGEDILSGTEYIRRLRRQYERLNPRPEWASYASPKPRKRRRLSNGESATESSEEEVMGMDMDRTDLQARPLARLLREAQSLVAARPQTDGAKKERKFRADVIDIQRTKDISTGGPSAISTIQVHPSLPLLISSGQSGLLSLHHLKPHPPNPNPLLTTVHVRRTALTTISFHPSSSDPRIFMSGKKRHIHIWNLSSGKVEQVSQLGGHQDEQGNMERFKLSPDGKYLALLGAPKKGGGVLNILDATTMQWVAQARIESLRGIADFSWWRDSAGLCVAGTNGEITEWSLAGRRVVARWRDEGAVGTTTLALGGKTGKSREAALGGDKWVAVGSSTGIVNVYNRKGWGAAPKDEKSREDDDNNFVPRNPTPLRVLDNLVTSISHLSFSPCGQVLCMASQLKNSHLRLVNLPTCNVYKNWPTRETPLGRVSGIAWGEVEGELWLVVGNEAGKIRAFALRG